MRRFEMRTVRVAPARPREGARGRASSPGTAPSALPIESWTKFAAGGAALCYAAGLVVVNSYLLPYGASDFNLFRARFVFTGLLLLASIMIASGGAISAAQLVHAAVKIIRNRHRKVTTVSFRRRALMAAVYIGCAASLASSPIAIFVRLLHQKFLAALELYFLAAVFGCLIAVGMWFFRQSSRDRAAAAAGRQPKPRLQSEFELPDWLMVPLLGVFVVPYALLMTSQFATQVYPRVPEQLGGARPRNVELLVPPDRVSGLQRLGIETHGTDGDATAAVSLIFRGEDFYLVRADKGVVVLQSDVIKAVRPID